jgi:hypothetical protein
VTGRTGFNGNIDYVTRSTGSHIFYTTTSVAERMRITSSGNVGIGTSANIYILEMGHQL